MVATVDVAPSGWCIVANRAKRQGRRVFALLVHAIVACWGLRS